MFAPRRIFLDTNIYILGAILPDSFEAAILEWLGFFDPRETGAEVIVSDALFQQILRVARRVQNKDLGGELLARLWRNLSVRYVFLEEQDVQGLFDADRLPREDVTVFLTARAGEADCFVSANHKLIRILAAESNLFECLTPQEFVAKYLEQ